MRIAPFLLAITLGASLAGCTQPPQDTARIAPGALGSNQDNDARATGLAAFVFADPSPARVNPVDIARAAASVDYLAGEIRSNPRYDGLPPLLGQQFADAKQELRSALGVRPGAPSQRVVDGLLQAADGMLMQDRARAEGRLTPDVFALGGPATLARLSQLPALPATNVATARLAAALNGPGDMNCFGCR